MQEEPRIINLPKKHKDIYTIACKACFSQPCNDSRHGPALCVMTLSIMLLFCGIMLGVSAAALYQQPFFEHFAPAREYRDVVTNFLIMTTCVTFVVGLWGIGTYKVTHRLFIATYGLGVGSLTVILTGFTFIFWTLSNLDNEMMEAFCPGKPWKLNEEFDLLYSIEDAVYELDYYSDLASSFMCSPICPCAEQSSMDSWSGLDEE